MAGTSRSNEANPKSMTVNSRDESGQEVAVASLGGSNMIDLRERIDFWKSGARLTCCFLLFMPSLVFDV